MPDRYTNYSELSRSEVEGQDYRVYAEPRPSPVAVIAPHGGAIEPGTSNVATMIAGEEFGLYLFEGTKDSGNYAALHVTSANFDDPRCLDLIGRCETVVAIHGCGPRHGDSTVLLGGRDQDLIRDLIAALRPVVSRVSENGHSFPGTHPSNICNRGASSAGVQIELTPDLRIGENAQRIADTVRTVLLARSQGAA